MNEMKEGATMNALPFPTESHLIGQRIPFILGPTCRVFLPLDSVTHPRALPRLSVVNLDTSIP